MTKKQAHAFLVSIDLLFILLLWVGYNAYDSVLVEISNHPDIIKVGSRSGFFIVCVAVPLFHGIIVLDNLLPNIIKPYARIINVGSVIFVISLIVASFVGSSRLISKVENAGYYHCREASGLSALAKTLVYTANRDICGKIVAEISNSN